MQAIGASERMFELLDRVPSIPLHKEGGREGEVKEKGKKGKKEEGVVVVGEEEEEEGRQMEGKLYFDNIKFAYPSRPDVSVLENFSLHVEPNATVALVGAR